MSTHLHIIADDPIERTHTELVQRAKELNRCLRHMGLQIQNQREITHPERVTSKQTRMKTPKFITVD